ncbi:MAG: hypothetical protein NC123_20235 [Butyrivibrio sp.]|nr:hypothetical protein [Butyrivibrio sp.]
MESMVQKSLRLPSTLVDFINEQPGPDFSKKLVGLLTEYKNGDLERKLMLQRYDEQIAERRGRLDVLMQNINRVSTVSRRVDALLKEVDLMESAENETI